MALDWMGAGALAVLLLRFIVSCVSMGGGGKWLVGLRLRLAMVYLGPMAWAKVCVSQGLKPLPRGAALRPKAEALGYLDLGYPKMMGRDERQILRF